MSENIIQKGAKGVSMSENIEGCKIKTTTKIKGVKSKQIQTWVSLHNALTKARHSLTEGRKSKRYLALDYFNILCYKKCKGFSCLFHKPKEQKLTKNESRGRIIHSRHIITIIYNSRIQDVTMLQSHYMKDLEAIQINFGIWDHRISRSK